MTKKETTKKLQDLQSATQEKDKKKKAQKLHQIAHDLAKMHNSSGLVLGMALSKIKKEGLYKEEPYNRSSFNEYLEKDLDISVRHAHRLIKAYETDAVSDDDKLDLGVTKLQEIARIPERERRRIFAPKAKELSVKQCKIIVKAIIGNPDQADEIIEDPEDYLNCIESEEPREKQEQEAEEEKSGTQLGASPVGDEEPEPSSESNPLTREDRSTSDSIRKEEVTGNYREFFDETISKLEMIREYSEEEGGGGLGDGFHEHLREMRDLINVILGEAQDVPAEFSEEEEVAA